MLVRTMTAAVLAFAVQVCGAQPAYPSKAITYVVPNAAGGSGDLIARVIAPRLSAELGVPVVVENKAGATGAIGAQFVANSAPDGHTLLANSTGPMTILPALNPNLGFDPLKSFDPIVKLGDYEVVLVVPAQSPLNSVQDVLKAARATPGAISYGSGGIGTMLHLQGELLQSRYGVRMTHIPYKGDSAAVQDVMAGHVSMMFASAPAVASYIAAGKLKAIATTAGARLPNLPSVPTMVEAGVPDFAMSAWFGAYVPAGTPPAVAARLNAAFNAVLSKPEVVAELGKIGLTVAGGPPSELAKTQQADAQRWSKVVRDAGVRME